MKRPFILDYVEGKQELIRTINSLYREKEIPFYMLETIVEEALYEVKVQSQAEVYQARRNYEDSLHAKSEYKAKNPQGELSVDGFEKQENEITLEEAAANE